MLSVARNARTGCWLRGVAQVLPVHWPGLGLRSVFLPDELAATELGGSWQHLETFGVPVVQRVGVTVRR